MTYEEWEAGVDEARKREPLWKMRVYRLASFVGDVSWGDTEALARNPLTAGIATQLLDALGSIRVNIGEGYSRSGGRDRARFFEYALGSTRESLEWYRQVKPALGGIVEERRAPLDEIVRMLLAIIPRERVRKPIFSRPSAPPAKKQKG